MGWIDVNEKMPPQGLQVLIELSGYGRAEHYSFQSDHDFFIGSWIVPEGKTEGEWLVWDCCEGDSHFTSVKVHAWMPLPRRYQPQELLGHDDGYEHPMFEDDPEWLYKGDCVYEQMSLEDYMNQSQKPKLKQKDVLGILDCIREYRQQCEDDCKGIERCEKCNQMLFDEIEEIVRRESDD